MHLFFHEEATENTHPPQGPLSWRGEVTMAFWPDLGLYIPALGAAVSTLQKERPGVCGCPALGYTHGLCPC